MFCGYCGKDMPQNSKFCPYCGRNQTAQSSGSVSNPIPLNSSYANRPALPVNKSSGKKQPEITVLLVICIIFGLIWGGLGLLCIFEGNNKNNDSWSYFLETGKSNPGDNEIIFGWILVVIGIGLILFGIIYFFIKQGKMKNNVIHTVYYVPIEGQTPAKNDDGNSVNNVYSMQNNFDTNTMT